MGDGGWEELHALILVKLCELLLKSFDVPVVLTRDLTFSWQRVIGSVLSRFRGVFGIYSFSDPVKFLIFINHCLVILFQDG